MTASWTAPMTWSGALVTVAQMNQHIRDNFEFLKDPPTSVVLLTGETNKTTTSTTFVDVDAAGDPDFSLVITTAGGDVWVYFNGIVSNPTNVGFVYFDFTVDGVRHSGVADGLTGAGMATGSANDRLSPGFKVLVTTLAAGAHTFALQWRVAAGTATLYTNTSAVPFGVREG